MTYSISATGHVSEPEAGSGQTADQIEAELAVKLHELLSQPKYGCGLATLSSSGFGPVNLLATAGQPDAGIAEPDEATSST